MKNLLLIVWTSIVFFGCAKDMPDAACENGKGKGVKAHCNGLDNPFTKGQVKYNGATLGYILSFEEGWALVYLREEKKYVEVDVTSGNYRVYPTARSTVIYFSERNCKGNAIIEVFNGEVGKTVIYTRDNRYFLVTELKVYSPTKFQAWSQLSLTTGTLPIGGPYTADSEICRDLGDKGDSFDRIAGTLTETTRPYDFAKIAPFTIEY